MIFKNSFCHSILQTRLFQWHGHRNPKNVHTVVIVAEEADVVVEDADVVEGVDESEEAHNMNMIHELFRADFEKTSQKFSKIILF